MLSPNEYYDTVADGYDKHYLSDLMDMDIPYPANYFRLQLLKKSFADRKNIIDVGCGDGTATKSLGIPVCGFDVSPKMAEKAGGRFIVADIMDEKSYAPLLEYGPFDGLTAMGVMPHIENEERAILNMSRLVKGKVFVEFRNELFSLFTFNRLTVDLVARLSDPDWRDVVRKRLDFLRLDLPPERPYDRMLAKFHNPFEMKYLFECRGFHDVNIWYYHYHPAPPFLEEVDPELFRVCGMERETTQSWRSMFVCSAFVIEARND